MGEQVSKGLGTSNGGELTESDRRATVSYLLNCFSRSLSREDVEDVVQEAMIVIYVRREGGEEIDNPGAFLRTVAWRDARDLIRARREMAFDPAGRLLGGIVDQSSQPEERLGERAELARAIEAVEQLEPALRAAYRARFIEELSTEEVGRRYGVPSSTYYHRLRRAIEGVRTRCERKRFAVKLLTAYIAGVASGAECRRAERLIRNDPRSAALAREL